MNYQVKPVANITRLMISKLLINQKILHFHSNINGLGSKLDNLDEFLTGTPTKMAYISQKPLKIMITGF